MAQLDRQSDLVDTLPPAEQVTALLEAQMPTGEQYWQGLQESVRTPTDPNAIAALIGADIRLAEAHTAATEEGDNFTAAHPNTLPNPSDYFAG